VSGAKPNFSDSIASETIATAVRAAARGDGAAMAFARAAAAWSHAAGHARRLIHTGSWKLLAVGVLLGALLAWPLLMIYGRSHWTRTVLLPVTRATVTPPTAADLALAANWADRNDSLVIVAWTTVFGEPFGEKRLDGGPGKSCPRRCLISNRRALLPYAKGVLFHARDVQLEDLPERDVNGIQPWVLFTAETPPNDFWPSSVPDQLRLFDYSMTYRVDSDFPLTYLPTSLAQIVRKPPAMPLTAKKTAAHIAWVQSNCNTYSDREKYIAELMKHVRVHSYGGCLRNQSPWPTVQVPAKDGDVIPVVRDKKVSEIFAEYRFAIVAENSDCRDYVSEKLLNVLEAGVVPIVGGPRAMYASFLPVPDAALFMDEHTPEELAARVRALAKDDAAYLHMLRYREGVLPEGQAPVPFSSDFNVTVHRLATSRGSNCQMCMRLHEDWDGEREYLARGRGTVPSEEQAAAYSPIRGSAVRPDRECVRASLDPDVIRAHKRQLNKDDGALPAVGEVTVAFSATPWGAVAFCAILLCVVCIWALRSLWKTKAAGLSVEGNV